MPKIKIILLTILILPACFYLNAQNETAPFKRAEQATTLLRNEGRLLPLQRLDTLQIAYLRFGTIVDDRFLSTAKKYTDISIEEVPATLDTEWFDRIQSQYNLLLLEIQDYPIGNSVPPAYQQKSIIQALVKLPSSITTITGDGSIFQVIPSLQKAPHLLIAPNRMKFAPSIAAQIIFGGMPANGRLLGPIAGAGFRRGSGLNTTATRLGYAPPGYVDMEAQVLEDSITAILQEGIQKKAFPGAQVLVARKGKVVYHQAFGYHTDDSLRAVSPEDVYDLASITKIAGPLPVLMKLHGEGHFDLDAPLKAYFPRFRWSNKAKLTFRPMLAHHARLRPWIPYWRSTLKWNAKYPWRKGWDKERINDYDFRCRTFELDSSKRYPIRVTDSLWLHHKYQKQIYRGIRKSPLNEEPGYTYSGLLFYLLPEIIENITEQDYLSYLNDHIYGKLQANLTYRPMDHFPKSQIVPTERDTFFRMQLLHGTVHDEGAAMMDGISGNAGLFGTANGLAKLMALYLNEGNYGGEQIIAAESLREFTNCQYCEEGNRRGLGFDKPLIKYDRQRSSVAEAASPESFGHSGYTGTFTWVDPKQELIYIFLSNRVYPTRANKGIYQYNIWPRIHAVLYQACRDVAGEQPNK